MKLPGRGSHRGQGGGDHEARDLLDGMRAQCGRQPGHEQLQHRPAATTQRASESHGVMEFIPTKGFSGMQDCHEEFHPYTSSTSRDSMHQAWSNVKGCWAHGTAELVFVPRAADVERGGGGEGGDCGAWRPSPSSHRQVKALQGIC